MVLRKLEVSCVLAVSPIIRVRGPKATSVGVARLETSFTSTSIPRLRAAPILDPYCPMSVRPEAQSAWAHGELSGAAGDSPRPITLVMREKVGRVVVGWCWAVYELAVVSTCEYRRVGGAAVSWRGEREREGCGEGLKVGSRRCSTCWQFSSMTFDGPASLLARLGNASDE
jgi:hypothetical protein